jgi:hypothetical protein
VANRPEQVAATIKAELGDGNPGGEYQGTTVMSFLAQSAGSLRCRNTSGVEGRRRGLNPDDHFGSNGISNFRFFDLDQYKTRPDLPSLRVARHDWKS